MLLVPAVCTFIRFCFFLEQPFALANGARLPYRFRSAAGSCRSSAPPRAVRIIFQKEFKKDAGFKK
ncbi:hypothetical protein [Methanimicrococcus hacksteinii]|uniref:hypothetical protein n=1 Tax=Methanimicrococcus hacksteinii TaxID=3028293 RepID=UPI00298F2C8A|nr:hypothetical protein [Methanimicrococcus sp. At1]